jgi:hypothetical protein
MFVIPRQVLLSSAGLLLPGFKVYFYATGTTTLQNTYTTSALSVANTNPVVADAAGVLGAVWLDPTLTYKVTFKTSADVTLYTEDPITESLTQSQLGAILYPRTAAEIAASVTPTNYAYPPGDVRRYGAVGDGSTSDTTAFTNALLVSMDTHADDGTWMIQGVTIPDGQSISGDGRQTVIKKRANGAAVTLAKNAQLRDLYIDGNGANFTGSGVTIPATIEFDGFQHVVNCIIRNTASYCVEYTAEFAGFCSILLGCDFKTTDEATTPAVKWGVETGITKHGNRYIIGCTAGSGPIVDASGSQNGCVMGSMAGGSSSAGLIYNSASAKIVVMGNRLAATAAQVIDGTDGVFTGNVVAGDITLAATADRNVVTGNVSAGVITLASGAKRCVVKGNVVTSVTDSSGSVGSNSNLVEITHTTYTPTLTSANADASLGNGTIVGYYSRNGRTVKATAQIILGSTTSFGTGLVYISLPFIPSANIAQHGSALLLDSGTLWYVAVSRTLVDGTARAEIFPPTSATGPITATTPFTWTTSDQLQLTIVYDM